MSNFLRLDEQVIWESSPAVNVDKNIPWYGKIGLLIFIFLGLSTLIFYGLGLVFLAIAGYYYFSIKRRKNPYASMHYTLTNQRALLTDNEYSGTKIAQECDLTKIVAVSQNKTNIAAASRTQQSARTISNVIGDVVFLEGPNVKLKFEYVVDPDAVVKTVEEVKKSYFVGK